ncbi:MAG: HU family DNA-binding protein [Bacteroidales bacterium]|nr:HU family DNA-binding protein [Bacteroidales bacterium]
MEPTKSIATQVARKMDRGVSEVNTLIDALAGILREQCQQLNTVAIPGFGAFEPVKEDEKIITDLSSGKRMLLPPCVTLTFKPSHLLKKRLNIK